MKTNLKNLSLVPKNGLSKREFMLIVLLVVAIEGYLLYSCFIQPALAEYRLALTDMEIKTTMLDGLKSDNAQREAMESEIAGLEEQLAGFEKQLPAYLSQEEVILLVDSLSNKNLLSVNSISFQNASEIPLKALTPSKSADEADKTDEADKADKAGKEDKADKNGTDIVPTLIDQKVSITFVGEYPQIYDFIKDIEANLRKVAVTGITMQRTDTEDLTGMISLSFLSYWDGSKGQKPFEMVSVPIPGKASPFEEYPGYSANREQAAGIQNGGSRADFYLMINSYLNNSAKVVLMNYYNSDSAASEDTNGMVKAKITLEGNDGKYTYQYDVGSSSKSETAGTEVRDGRIRLEVLAQARDTDQDKVSVALDIENKTDVPFEITVTGDDAGNPRFVPGTVTGNVTFK